MDNVENQYIINLCTNYCCCINIGSDQSSSCSVPILILVKNAISVTDILADPVIGTPLIIQVPKNVEFSTRVGTKAHQ